MLLVACARIEAPPGGPPDTKAPSLVATQPDSVRALPNFDGEVEFVFDEVISEGGQPSRGLGTGDLEKLVILSPTTRVPEVSWRRRRITVKPAEGWQPNRTYRVQLLPGVVDLRQNRSTAATVVTFTTGGPTPETTLQGVVYDWATATPARGALVEAALLPDSLPYRVVADSSGAFRIGPLPRGEYLVYGVIDQNRNLLREPREAYDTALVAAGDSAVAELWTFAHDTAGPRIQTASHGDSVTAALTFTQQLDPAQRFDSTSVSALLLPDSTPVAVRSLLPAGVHDSVYRAAADTARARDTLRAPRDTAGRPDRLRPPRDTARAADSLRVPADSARARPSGRPTSRKALSDRLMIRFAEPLRPGARYAIEVRDVRNVNLVPATARGVLPVPEPRAPADSVGADSLRADSTRADSGRAGRVGADSLRPDSLRADSVRAGTRADSLRADSVRARPAPADTTRRPR